LLPNASECEAAEVTLAWDSNIEPEVTGYKLHYGTATGSYSNIIDVGNVLQYTITGLREDVRYYVAATAYSETHESDFSEEIDFVLASNPVDPLDPFDRIIIGSLIEMIEENCMPITPMQPGRNYEITTLPNGSRLFSLPSLNSGNAVEWSN
jgi:hypothetical protein